MISRKKKKKKNDFKAIDTLIEENRRIKQLIISLTILCNMFCIILSQTHLLKLPFLIPSKLSILNIYPIKMTQDLETEIETEIKGNLLQKQTPKRTCNINYKQDG